MVAISREGQMTQVNIRNTTIYFSYQTIVAFHDDQGLVVCENIWSRSTGKHINAIDNGNKDNRLDADRFEVELRSFLDRHKL